MTLSISPVEGLWVSLNFTTFILTLFAVIDARADRAAVRLLNGKARELAASGTVRREGIRLGVQTLLLLIAVPGLFLPGDTPLNLFVISLMGVAVLLLLSSIFDARDRKAMVILVAAELLVESASAFSRLEKQNRELAAALAENTAMGVVTESTVEDTATKVADIHDVTVKNGGGK